jgi:hypothetical protein
MDRKSFLLTFKKILNTVRGVPVPSLAKSIA